MLEGYNLEGWITEVFDFTQATTDYSHDSNATHSIEHEDNNVVFGWY